MSALEKSDVARLAALARIDMTDDDLGRLSGQISAIVDAVATISGAVGDDVPATSHPVPMANVFREDVVQPSLTPEDALAAAPEAYEGRFRVPQILGEEA